MINEPEMASLSDLRKAFLAALVILAASLLLGACAPMEEGATPCSTEALVEAAVAALPPAA
jgi:hypothetical protein